MKRCPYCKKFVWPWQTRSQMAWPTAIHLRCHATNIACTGIPLSEILGTLREGRSEYPALARDYDDMETAILLAYLKPENR